MIRPDHDRARAEQMRQAEELLFAGPQKMGFAKGLFAGRFVAPWVMPYPRLSEDAQNEVDQALAELRAFMDEHHDPAAIDRRAQIPREVIDGLGRLGVLGMTAPAEYGGRGFSQMAYCQVMQEIGRRCASTSVFVNAHHSIGIRALLLFGSEEQKRRWLPPLVRGEQLAAFALTEPQAGSDAANVQTTATLSSDGRHYLLNGEKRYITNGAIAHVLTVMARTESRGQRSEARSQQSEDRGQRSEVRGQDPKPDLRLGEGPDQADGPDQGSKSQVTAFLVTPDMPGFQVTEARMEKLGIRGTVTSRLAFHDMPVPRENILGPEGKGLKVALTVLDFGRTTFGACCTGAGETCLRLAVSHANARRQFGRTLGEFELVRAKIAFMASHLYAMQAMTRVTASLIDRGLEDYMLETAMLKVFCTESLWRMVDDAFQLHGGAAYFTDRPLERMLRDARINQIGEGANDVLWSFIALVGMRGPGQTLKQVWDALHHPWAERRTVWRFGLERASAAVHTPEVPVRHHLLKRPAEELGRLIRRFEREVSRSLIHHGEAILDRQLVQERIARAATQLFAAACVLSRRDAELEALGQGADKGSDDRGQGPARLFLQSSFRHVRTLLRDLHRNEDPLTIVVAEQVLREG